VFVIGENVGDFHEFLVASNTWYSRPSMPNPTWGFAMESTVEEIFVISGYNTAAVSKFNVSSNQWFSLAPVPTTERFSTSTHLNGAIFILGGNGSGPINSEITQYLISSNLWTVVSHLNHPRYNGTCCVLNGAIYYVGGEYDSTGTPALKIEKFDPLNNTCVELAAMSKMRDYPLLFPTQGKIFAFGGSTVTNGIVTGEWIDGEIYDPSSNTWTTIPFVGKNGVLDFSAFLNGKMFLFGNRELQIFDPVSATWDCAPLPTEPLVNGSLSMKYITIINGRLFVPTQATTSIHFAIY
jgi:hypothetical protein